MDLKALAYLAFLRGSLLSDSGLSMASLGFEAGSTVSVGDFLKMSRRKIGINAFVPVRWHNNAAATISNGSISVEMNGGFLLVNGTGDINNTEWSSYICIYFPLNSAAIYRFSARTLDNPKNLDSVVMSRIT